MFRVTPLAAQQIRQAAGPASEGAPITLRVAAKFENGEIVYGMGFDEVREQDAVIECEGVTILISPRSLPLLTGTTLDFVEIHPGEFQFVFINPNELPPSVCASRTSGCGSCGGGSCA